MTLRRTTPLRRTPFKRKALPSSSPTSRKAIKVRSDKRAREAEEYRKLREKLVEHPSAKCKVCGFSKPHDLHHRREMSMGGAYTNPANVVPVCRNPCHEWIHSHPQEARELGFLVFEGDPEWTDLGARAWRNR